MKIISIISVSVRNSIKNGVKRLISLNLVLFCSIMLGSMLVHSSVQAFIYDIRVMRKWDNLNNYYCYFIGLGDFHDKRHKITPSQIKQIDEIVNKCHPDKTKLIFEDISSKNSVGTRCCGNFFVNSNGGILGGLTRRYKNKNLNLLVENIEYRFCRVASLAPVINNINANYRKFLPTSSIKVQRFKNEVLGVAKKLLGYNDNIVLKNWYKKCIAQAENNMKLLKFNSMSHMSVADYIYYNTNEKNRLPFVKKLLVFDTSLIDAKIVHSIVSAKKKQNIVVIAGGSHIKNVSRVLQLIGFTSIYNSKILLKKEYNPKKCLGCNVAPGGFCSKPQPVDLKILHRFL